MFSTGPRPPNAVAGQQLTSKDSRIIERVLGMEGGYLLDLNHRQLTQLIADFNVDFDDEKYLDLGSSKANKFRSFLRQNGPPLVGEVLSALLEHRMENPAAPAVPDTVINQYKEIAARFGAGAPSIPIERARTPATEPSFDYEKYEHILSVCENMVDVMERDPTPYRGMEEEHLRSLFLVQLNGHYKGGASGETFNYLGKTDILLRHEGKVAFVAECKFWGGPAAFPRIVDQLLGYTSWRDTKTAILLFSRNKDTSAVVAQIPELLRSHPNHIRTIKRAHETQFRCVLRHRDDPNREVTLTVLVFDVPGVGTDAVNAIRAELHAERDEKERLEKERYQLWMEVGALTHRVPDAAERDRLEAIEQDFQATDHTRRLTEARRHSTEPGTPEWARIDAEVADLSAEMSRLEAELTPGRRDGGR